MKMRPNLLLLTGSAGTGKTFRCIEIFRQCLGGSDLAGLSTPAYFVLPNREHADRIHSLLLRDDRFRGVAGHHVMPVSDFIRYRTWSGRRVLSQSERSLLVERVLQGESWEWMGRSAATPGLAPLLSAFLREIKSARVTPSRWRQAVSATPEFNSARFRDLTRFWDSYEAMKDAMGARDAEDALENFVTEPHPAVDADLVVFDGFFSLTELQTAFVASLADRCRKVVFTLTLEPEARPELFAYPERLRTKLLELGFGEETLTHSRRAAQPGLIRLESGWGADSADSAGSSRVSPDGLQLVTAATRRQELEWIARDVLREVREGRRHFSDHMVIVRNLEGYRPWIEEIFDSLSVPYDVHERRRIEDHPWARALLQLLSVPCEEAGQSARRTEPWAAWIESSAAVGERPAAVRLAARLRSLPAVIRTQELDQDRALWGMSDAEAELWAQEKELAELVASAPAARWRDTLMGALARLAAGGSDTESDRVRPAVERSVQKFAVAEGNLPGIERLERLSSVLRGGLYSVRESSKNRVQFYDVILALPKEYKTVYVSGLSMGEFPREHRQSPLLSDIDRRRLGAAGVILDTAAARSENERYLFYMACTRASDRLILTRHALDDDGRERTASPWLEQVRDLFSGPVPHVMREPDELLPDPRTGDLRTPREVLEGLVRAHVEEDRPVVEALSRIWDGWPTLVRSDAGFAGSSFEVGTWRSRTLRTAKLQNPRAVADWSDPSGVPISASGVAALRQCAFKFFAQSALRIHDPEPSAAMGRGIFLHQLLQELLGGVEGCAALRLKELSEAEAARRAREWFDRRAAEAFVSGERAHERVWWIHLWRELFPKAVLRERAAFLSRTDFEPNGFEVSFSDLPHEAEGVRFRLKGYIDRTDVSTTAPRQVLAVDYKSGALPAGSALARGEAAQALVYPTALKALGFGAPLGLEYVSLARDERRRFVAPDALSPSASELTAFNAFKTDAEYQQAMAQEWSRVAAAMLGVLSGNLEPTPSDRVCRSCAHGSVCRKRAEGLHVS